MIQKVQAVSAEQFRTAIEKGGKRITFTTELLTGGSYTVSRAIDRVITDERTGKVAAILCKDVNGRVDTVIVTVGDDCFVAKGRLGELHFS